MEEIPDEELAEIDQYIYGSIERALAATSLSATTSIKDTGTLPVPTARDRGCTDCGWHGMLADMMASKHGFDDINSADMLLMTVVMSLDLFQEFLRHQPQQIEDPDGHGAIIPVMVPSGWDEVLDFAQRCLTLDGIQLVDFLVNEDPEHAMDFLHLILHIMVNTSVQNAVDGVTIEWGE